MNNPKASGLGMLILILGVGCDPGGVEPGDEEDPILCATKFEAAGDLSHQNGTGESCDAAGSWTINLSTPTADEEHTECSEAPGEQAFTLNVSGNRDSGYAAVESQSAGRIWSISVSDKSGSCAGSFSATSDKGVNWSFHVVESGPDGPLSGSGRYEQRR